MKVQNTERFSLKIVSLSVSYVYSITFSQMYCIVIQKQPFKTDLLTSEIMLDMRFLHSYFFFFFCNIIIWKKIFRKKKCHEMMSSNLIVPSFLCYVYVRFGYYSNESEVIHSAGKFPIGKQVKIQISSLRSLSFSSVEK